MNDGGIGGVRGVIPYDARAVEEMLERDHTMHTLLPAMLMQLLLMPVLMLLTCVFFWFSWSSSIKLSWGLRPQDPYLSACPW